LEVEVEDEIAAIPIVDLKRGGFLADTYYSFNDCDSVKRRLNDCWLNDFNNGQNVEHNIDQRVVSARICYNLQCAPLVMCE
jgi:hypothetical protein